MLISGWPKNLDPMTEKTIKACIVNEVWNRLQQVGILIHGNRNYLPHFLKIFPATDIHLNNFRANANRTAAEKRTLTALSAVWNPTHPLIKRIR